MKRLCRRVAEMNCERGSEPIMNLREWRRYAGDIQENEARRGIGGYLSLVLSF